ncbi:hypothetical protein [Nocardia aurantia]|uniref:Uncharacterized protein n=1 Tax=Nocardia aurantia TaxID=2585199 RepID=A0A7K0DGQ4_9NOCA|nr:hypothetical protein [Nocardia aurantia]MQY24996.1 hypothetical protein [Nocardia aurantia]
MDDVVNDDKYDPQLRRAAIRVLDAHDESGRSAALADLDRALSGIPVIGGDSATPVLDPARHSLGAVDYRGTLGRPIPLAQRALDIRSMLEEEGHTTNDAVVITSMRGLVIGNLLYELGSRLAPGEAFGIGADGTDLAIAALDIAAWLNDPQSGYSHSDWAKRTPMPLPTDVDPVAEARELRAAALDVVRTSTDPHARDAALEALHRAVRGPIPKLRTRPGRIPGDASRHLLWSLESAAILKRPPTLLLEEAERARRSLAADRAVDERQDGDFNLEFGEPRAMACAALLTELSLRLRPGAAFGPGRDGIPLAAVADELARNLLSQTVLG